MLYDIAQYQDAGHSILGISKCLSIADDAISAGDNRLFDLCRCRWMQIGEVVALASFFRTVRSRGLCVEGRYLPNSEVGTYLTRMDFFKVQDIVREEHFQRHDSDMRFLSLTPIEWDANANEIPSKLRNIVLAKTEVDESLVGALDYAFGEIVDNVLTHSRAHVEGLVGAQYYPAKSFVEFCVADGGVGVAQTLRGNPAYSTLCDSELLVKSLDYGVGENTWDFRDDAQGYGCGFGLTFAARLVEATQGDLWMVSNGAGIRLSKDGLTVYDGYNVIGTVICMRIPSNVRVSEDDVLRNGVLSPYGWNSADGHDNKIDDTLW